MASIGIYGQSANWLQSDNDPISARVARPQAGADRVLDDPAGPSQAKKIIAQRQMRRRLFGEELFEGPAWDLLLDLYVANEEGSVISLTCAGLVGGVPATTALRWIRRLADDGWITRSADRNDGRRTLIELTPEMRSKVRHYLSSLSDPTAD